MSSRKSADLLHSQGTGICHFYKRIVKMKKSIDHWYVLTYCGRRKYSERNLSQSTFSTINRTTIVLASNRVLRGQLPTTNPISFRIYPIYSIICHTMLHCCYVLLRIVFIFSYLHSMYDILNSSIYSTQQSRRL